ncbi:MAG TPA: dethiobiotin synthase [Solirubrobacteraceae bacterium]|jgi:dethiobiotin synthetase
MEPPARRVRGLFVTGTDTGVGKTVVSAAIVAGLVSLGFAVRPLKPLITGLDEPPDPIWPPDHEQLARVAGLDPDDVALLRYGPAVSPHLAAELTGEAVRPGELERAIRGAVHDGEVAVVEGAGGLLVPIAPVYDMRELAAALAMPLVVVARPGLGTINHTLLTLEAARSRGLSVAGVVLNPWPAEPDEIERSNRATIEQLGEVTVSVLPRLEAPDPAALAAAGGRLPLERWLA